MSDLNARLVWTGDQRFTGINGSGIETAIDGEHKTGASPVELLVEATAACSAIDVVLILAKMRSPAARLEMDLDADRREKPPRYLTRLGMRFDIWGDAIEAEKVERAIRLSVLKYCSVYNTLRPDMKLELFYRLHRTGAEAAGEYTEVKIEAGASSDASSDD